MEVFQGVFSFWAEIVKFSRILIGFKVLLLFTGCESLAVPSLNFFFCKMGLIILVLRFAKMHLEALWICCILFIVFLVLHHNFFFKWRSSSWMFFCLFSLTFTMKDFFSVFRHSKRTKYLGINWTEEVKGLYTENYKMLVKEIKEDWKKWKDLLYSWIERFDIVKRRVLPKVMYRFQYNLCQNPNGFFFFSETEKRILKFIGNFKSPE